MGAVFLSRLVEHTNDGRMRQATHLLRAPPETLNELRIVCRRTMQDLESDLLILDAIIGVPHRRHCALTNLAGQEVAIGQNQTDSNLERGRCWGTKSIGNFAGAGLDFSRRLRNLHRSNQTGRDF